jgi:hypothetical protein
VWIGVLERERERERERGQSLLTTEYQMTFMLPQTRPKNPPSYPLYLFKSIDYFDIFLILMCNFAMTNNFDIILCYPNFWD